MARFLLTASLIALQGALFPALAGVESCVTVNGQKTCASASHSLACQTIDGRTTCASGDGTVVVQQHYHSVQQHAVPTMPDRVRPEAAPGAERGDAVQDPEDDDGDD